MAAPTTSAIADLAQLTLDQLEDPAGTFWLRDLEINSFLAEAITELMLMIGRPMVQFNTLVTLQPNTPFQPMPSNLLSITNIRGGSFSGLLWKTTLHALDYLQASWTSSWQSDRAANPARWAPLGLRYFIVHPAPVTPVQVTLAGIQYPVIGTWPYSGDQQSPFHREIDNALQMYAVAAARLKLLGDDAQEGQSAYAAFRAIGQRLTQISDRQDSLAFTKSFGAPTAPSQTSSR